MKKLSNLIVPFTIFLACSGLVLLIVKDSQDTNDAITSGKYFYTDGNIKIEAITLRGCEYFIASSSGVALIHHNGCDNPKHKSN